MYLQKLLPVFFFIVISNHSFAQEKKYYLGTPLDIKQTGWNKVLCMKNGNTILFHFEHNKKIILNVYDSLHNLIAHQEHLCRYVDLFILKDAIFKGLYDINGEAVLFLEQEHLSKNRMIRLCFSSYNGSLTDEKIVGESKSMSKPTFFYVMKNNEDDTYAILNVTEISQFKQSNISVALYNNKHEQIREIPLDVDRKKFDYLKVIGAEFQSGGICITLSLANLELNGTSHNSAFAPGSADLYSHLLCVYYIPKNSSSALLKQVDLSQDFHPYYSNYTYNSLHNTLNLLLFSYQEITYTYGSLRRPGMLTANLFFKLNESNLDLTHNWVSDRIATAYLKQKTDTNHNFQGIPVKLFTNENGLSTLVSESYTRYISPTLQKSGRVYSYLGNICITQLDDDGNEIWGIILPHSQCHTSNYNYYNPKELSKRWQAQYIFSDLPEYVYNRQFCSFNIYSKNKNFYIVYNDYDRNFNNSIEHPGDTVYDFNIANTCYYKINKKNEIVKNRVFDEPAPNEYLASFIEGADFDEQRGVYAALVQYKKDDEITLRMAWSKLDQ